MTDKFLKNSVAAQSESPADQRRRSLILGMLAMACGSLPGLAHANALKIGQAAPPLVLHTLEGKDIATSELIGKIVVVTFFASYCDPCLEELPLLSEYAQRHAGNDLQVLGFCIDPPDNIEAVKKIAQTLHFPVGLLGSPYAGGYGRIWRMPVSFVIDRAGRLIDDGWKDENPAWSKERLNRVLDPLFQ
ncbi:cytochrome c biogenesis protein CcmG/thiol:disulfide interchange protein DsbE [Oxalobacteraceae bacterium GrIS 2.11]